MFSPNIIIILSRASDSGNVGAVCRAMKNMGLSRLRMVSPGPMDEKTIISRAIHAADVWENARFFDSLAEASADCSLLVGTTRRRGRKRKNITMEPRTLASWLAGRGILNPAHDEIAPAALVFGNERTGLEDSELDLCDAASHIPVSDDFPSLNLSHAVQIYAYELFLAAGGAGNRPKSASVKGEWTPMERQKVDALTSSITDTLAGLGFYKNPGREEQTRFLRDMISRAGLTEREGQYLAKIFAKAARLGSRLSISDE